MSCNFNHATTIKIGRWRLPYSSAHRAWFDRAARAAGIFDGQAAIDHAYAALLFGSRGDAEGLIERGDAPAMIEAIVAALPAWEADMA